MLRWTAYMLFGTAILVLLSACSALVEPDQQLAAEEPENPDRGEVTVPDGSLRIAALDYGIYRYDDPEVMASIARADLLVADCVEFWRPGASGNELDLIRALNPEIKIVGYFKPKSIPLRWGNWVEVENSYRGAMFQTSQPYWCSTTTGDTLQDWPGVAVYDFTNPQARQEMLEVFVHFQTTSGNKFDGVFYDYFNRELWVAPMVDTMEGEPDMNGNGIVHWDDPEELEDFRAGQVAYIQQMRAAMGDDFLQIANGSRAAIDSVFAGHLDGMYYELFPNVGFSGAERMRAALDPGTYNNLFAARNWPRKQNGGPWLLLGNASPGGTFQDSEGDMVTLNNGDLNRVVALLTGATSLHFDNSGSHSAGLPRVELALGQPLGGVEIEGDRYYRQFENGEVELVITSGSLPIPFSYSITQGGTLVEALDYPMLYP
jgi:hypothetical protein